MVNRLALIFAVLCLVGCGSSFEPTPNSVQIASVTTATTDGNSSRPPDSSPTSPSPDSSPAASGEVNVTEFGADTTGKADSTPAFNSAISQLTNSGGVVKIPCGKFRISSTVILKMGLSLIGLGSCSKLFPDEGITAIYVTGSDGGPSQTLLKSFSIYQLHPHPKNIGIRIESGPVGAANWILDGLAIEGSGMGGIRTSGVGVQLDFALKGVIQNSSIEYWKIGVNLEPMRYAVFNNSPVFSNANDLRSNKIRGNEIGIKVQADNIFLSGNTIEGNLTGIIANTVNGVIAYGNHFEQSAIFGQIDGTGMISGPLTDIVVEAGPLVTLGNLFTSGLLFRGNSYWSASGDYVTYGRWCSNQPKPTRIGAQYATAGEDRLSYGGELLARNCNDYYQGYSWMTGNWGACSGGVQRRMIFCVDDMGVGIDPYLNLCPGGMAARPQDSRNCN